MNGISKSHTTLFQTSMAAKVVLILLATSSFRIFFSCTPHQPRIDRLRCHVRMLY